jgi:hypothetical protein
MRDIWRLTAVPEVNNVVQFLNWNIFDGGMHMALQFDEPDLVRSLVHSIAELAGDSVSSSDRDARRAALDAKRQKLEQEFGSADAATADELRQEQQQDEEEEEEEDDEDGEDEVLFRRFVREGLEMFGEKETFVLSEDVTRSWQRLAIEALRWARAFGFVPLRVRQESAGKRGRFGRNGMSVDYVVVPDFGTVTFALRRHVPTGASTVVALADAGERGHTLHGSALPLLVHARESSDVHVFTWSGYTPDAYLQFRTPIATVRSNCAIYRQLLENALAADFESAHPLHAVRTPAQATLSGNELSELTTQELYGDAAIQPPRQRAEHDATMQSNMLYRVLLGLSQESAMAQRQEQVQQMARAPAARCVGDAAPPGGHAAVFEATGPALVSLPPGAEADAFARPAFMPHLVELLNMLQRSYAGAFGVPHAMVSGNPDASEGRSAEAHRVQQERVRGALARERNMVRDFCQHVHAWLLGRQHSMWLLCMLQAVLQVRPARWRGTFTAHDITRVFRDIMRRVGDGSLLQVSFPKTFRYVHTEVDEIEHAHNARAITLLERINSLRMRIGLEPVTAESDIYAHALAQDTAPPPPAPAPAPAPAESS